LHTPSGDVKRRRRNNTGKKSIRGGIYTRLVFSTVFSSTALSLDAAHKAALLRKADDGLYVEEGPPPRWLAVL
jgi:hypothetical protein